jgi:DNA-binding GntR family transcriptional regulator
VAPFVSTLTANERAYYEIKSMIARHELLPGGVLSLRALATKLKLSRTPIVEAIRRLERDGLVTAFARWSATVKQWTNEEILEAYYIRRALEGEAARHFVLRARPEDKKRLVELSNSFDSLVGVDFVRSDEVDRELHLHIVRATGFKQLCDLVENSKIQTATIWALSIKSLERKKYSGLKGVGGHKRLVKALLGNSPDAAVAAMWNHIDTVLESLVELDGSVEGKDRLEATRKAI